MGLFDRIAQAASGNYASQNNQYSGGSGGYGGMQQQMPQQAGGYSWGNFLDRYQQLQQANQQMQQQPSSAFSQRNQERNEPVRRREMTAIERFGAEANKVTEDLSSYSGWNPEDGWTPENIGKFAVGLPGMFLSAVPDTLATGAEIITGTPIKEADLSTNTIEDRQLTAAQRAADVGYLGATALSMALGPEARLAGVGAKAVGGAAKAAGRKGFSKAVDNAAGLAVRGGVKEAKFLETAAKNAGAGKTGTKAAMIGDTLLETGASAIVEGAEEGTQSLFEDIRYDRLDENSIDRMKESAAWGALGGGMFGGLTGAVTTTKDIINMDKDQAVSGSPKMQAQGLRQTTQDQWSELQTRNTSGRITPAQKKYYDDRAKADNRLRNDGSVIVVLSDADGGLELNQWRAGSDDFVDAYKQNATSQARLANNITGGKLSTQEAIETVDRAINGREVDGQQYNTVSEALTAVNEKFNGKNGFESAIEKRPGAHYTGGYGYVTSFFEGRGFSANPSVAKQMGADHDSDQGTLHFATRDEKGRRLLNLNGRFSEKLLSPEGVVQTDFYYSNFNPERFNKQAWRTSMNKILGIFNRKKTNESGKKVSVKKYYSDKMINAMKEKDDGERNQKIAEVLDELRAEVDDMRTVAQEEAENGVEPGNGILKKGVDASKLSGGSRVISRLFVSDSHNILEELRKEGKAVKANQYAMAVANTIAHDPGISQNMKQRLVFDERSPLYRKGKLGKKSRAIDHFNDIGLVLYTLEERANQPFRQHGQLNLNHAKKLGAYTNAVDELSNLGLKMDEIDILIRCSFRIARTGTTPLEAIEGLIDERIVSSTSAKFDLENRRISSESEYEEALGYFVQAYDEGAADYRSVHKIPTADGVVDDPFAPTRNDITDADQAEKDFQFLQLFGDYPINDLFSDVPEHLVGYAYIDIVRMIAENPQSFSRIFANSRSQSLQRVVNRHVAAYASQKPRIRKQIRKFFSEMKISGVLDRMRKNGGKIHPSDYSAVTAYVSALVETITPRGMEYLGISDPIEFLQSTEIGNMLLHEKAAVRENTWFALLTKAKFGLYQDALKGRLDGLTEEEAKRAAENAKYALDEMSSHVGVQGRIASEMLLNNGDSPIFDVFSSIHSDFDTKEKMYKKQYEDGDHTDIIVDMMIEDNGDFAISSVSKKARSAEAAMAQYHKALLTESRLSISNIKTQVENGTLDPRIVEDAIMSACTAARIDINTDPVVVSIYNSLGTGISETEKGVEGAAPASLYESLVISEKGSPLSFIDSITSYGAGGLDIDNFAQNKRVVLALLSGQDISQIFGQNAVRISENGRGRIVTRDWVFSQVSESYDPAVGPRYQDWMAFLERFPQYEAMFADSVTQPILSVGEGSATMAKGSSLFDKVMEYNDTMTSIEIDGVDKVERAEIEHALHITENALLSDGRYGAMVIQCMDDLGLIENRSMETIRSSFLKLHHQFVRAIFYRAQRRIEDGRGNAYSEYSDILSSYRSTSMKSNIDEIDTIITDIIDAIDIYGRNDQALEADIQRAVSASNRAELNNEALSAFFDNFGHKIQWDRLEGGDGELSAGEISLIKARARAQYSLSKVEQIWSATENIDPLADELGEITPMTGVNGPEDVDIDHIKRHAEEQLGRPLTVDEVKYFDEQASQRGYESFASKRRVSSSPESTINSLKQQGILATDDEIAPDIPYLRYDMLPDKYATPIELIGSIDLIKQYIKSARFLKDFDIHEIKDRFYDEGGMLKPLEWKKFIREVNNRVIESTIRRTNEDLGSEINGNAYYAAVQYFDAVDDLIKKTHNELKTSKNPYAPSKNLLFDNLDFDFRDPGFPTPNFTNAINQGAVMNYTLMIAGSPVPGSISRNGGSLKTSHSVNALPTGKAGFIEPKPKTISELRDDIAHDPYKRQQLYVKSGTWAPGQDPYSNKDYVLGTVGGLLSSDANLADDATILVFDPEDNPHGMWATNTPASITKNNKPALRLASIIGAIIDGSQEPLVLKLKKRFEQRRNMVDDKSLGSRKPGIVNNPIAVNNAQDQSVENLRMLLVDSLKEYRRGFAKELNGSFENGEMKPLGFHYDQALILAQGLTPGMLCRVNGETVCISAETLWSENSFMEYVNGVVAREGKFNFELGETFTVSPKELHERIINAIDDLEYENSKAGANTNNSEMAEAAYKTITTGWDSYMDNPLSVDEIFSRGPVMGWAHNCMITPEEALTTFSKYLHVVTEGKSGSAIGDGTKRGKALTKGSNRALFDAVKIVSESLAFTSPTSSTEIKVMRLFIEDEMKRINVAGDVDFWSPLEGQPTDYCWPDSNAEGVGVVTDWKQFEAAVSWAEETGNKLLVANEIWNRLPHESRMRFSGAVDPSTYTSGQLSFSFKKINPSQALARQYHREQDSSSSTIPFDIDSIEGVDLDRLHLFNLGDASLLVDDGYTQYLDTTGASKVSIRGLTGDVLGKLSVIGKDSATSFKQALFEDDGTPRSNEVWRDTGINLSSVRFEDIPLATLQEDIYHYLDDLESGNIVDEDGFNRRYAGRNKVLGLISATTAEGDTVIVPLLAPNNSPEKYDHCGISIGKNGNIYITYSTRLQTFNGQSVKRQYFKASLPDMVYKGMVVVKPDDMELPTYSRAGNKDGQVRFVTSWDTVSSRRPGRESQMQISDMWYFSKKEGFSYLYDTDGYVKQNIVDQYTDVDGNIDKEHLNLLLTNDPREWDKVERQEIRLSDDDEVNDIISSIVRNHGREVEMTKLMSPGWDGERVRTRTNVRFYMALGKISNDHRILKFFHGMNENLCPDGLDDMSDEFSFHFNKEGEFRINHDGYLTFDYVKWGPPDGIGAFSELQGRSGRSGESNQAFVRLAMDRGYMGRDNQMALDYAVAQNADPRLYRQRMIENFANQSTDRIHAVPARKYEKPLSSLYYATRAEKEAESEFRRMHKTFDPRYRRKVYHRNKEVENPFSNDIDGNPVIDKYGELNALFEVPLSEEVVYGCSYYQTGHTYNDGKGKNQISLNHFANSLGAIAENIREQGLIVVSRDMQVDAGRIPQPLINEIYAREIWQNCKTIREHELNQKDGKPDFDTWVERMKEEQRKTDSVLRSSSDPKYTAKLKECRKFSEYNWRQWGMAGESGFIYEFWTAEDFVNTSNWFASGILEEMQEDGFDVNAYRELNNQSSQMMIDIRKASEGRRFSKEAPDPNSRTGQVIVGQPLDYSRPYHKLFRSATDATRLMSVLDIWMPLSNIGYRGINQSITSKVMQLGRGLLIDKKHTPNQDIIRYASRSDNDTRVLWGVLREAAFEDGQEEMFLYLDEGGSVEDFVEQKAKEGGKFRKIKDLVYAIAGGGDIGIEKQLENFLNRFVFFVNEDPTLRKYWLEKQSNGYNRMDQMLSQPGGGAAFLREIFSSQNNPSLLAAMQALESARGADLSQRHILIEMFKNATNNHPIPEFLATTMVTKFPRYALNIAEEVANLILPISTMRQCFIQFAAERGHEKAAKAAENGGNYIDPHYETLLRNTSIREAMLVDMLHFGAFGMLCLLAAIPGAVEPPDDEKKWGNYHEWLFLGYRVGEAWWMEDILGIVAPSACFWKSMQLGKPRIDLLVNGISDVCYNNPMIKVADAIQFAINPMDDISDDYELQKQKYAMSPDGEPSFMDYLQANGTSFGLSFVSQFFTPTFLKSLNNWATPYELDYKSVYKENVRGVATEGGAAGEDLVRTSYEDAMIRRLTRRNPALALLMDLTHPGTTSYSGLDAIANISGKQAMPYTRYLDQYQYNSMKSWSIDGMSESDAQAKTAEIIVTLMQYQDDLDALVATGFYLDTKTKAAVSSMIWDTYYQLDREWNEFNEDSSRSDYTVLGSGDWDAGKEQYYKIKQYYTDTKREINNFYYKTMKSKQLSQPIVEYRRYNTTYSQDDDGNWYATGFKPQGALPFTSAPGSLYNTEGTAGYENDFVSLSAATGLPLEGMRALVPANDGEIIEWPGLEEWADDGNGNGYSKQYQQWYGSNSAGSSTSANKTTTSTTPSSTRRSYGRSAYSKPGRSGGYSSGGSGGRNYVPNTSAPSVNLSRANASRIMNTDRIIRPDEEYLRPDFETKGSREAYKRSDI